MNSIPQFFLIAHKQSIYISLARSLWAHVIDLTFLTLSFNISRYFKAFLKNYYGISGIFISIEMLLGLQKGTWTWLKH